MSYKPLHEILSDLDAQQRQELAALSGQVDAAEIERARNAKKQLSTVSVFFIERTWEFLAPQLETFSLESASGKTAEELRAYLLTLRRQQPAFAWGWVRARMNACVMQHLDACVPGLLAQYPTQAAHYAESLGKVDSSYWFRAAPLTHLKAGYHTALGVACKWYGSTFELLNPASVSDALPSSARLSDTLPLPVSPANPPVTRPFPDELRRFASFSLTMLARTDGWLWDSAGAEPMDALLENGTLHIACKPPEELALAAAPDYGLRLGCPALRARREAGQPAFAGILAWVEQVFSCHLLP